MSRVPRSVWHWAWLPLLVLGVTVLCPPVSVPGRSPEPGPPLQTILELETTGRLLAILLDSGRAVINENQALFDDLTKGNKEFSPAVFERQLVDMFLSRAAIDLRTIDAVRLPEQSKELLRVLVVTSKQVVAEAQAEINREGMGYKGFVPGVFGSRVAGRFTERTGVRLKQTALLPRNPSNTPDPFEKEALQDFADPSYPHEKVISEVTAKSGALRLMYPLYTTRRCLDCHGEPKGVLDRSGYPREGLRLGQNAGAISVVIPLHQ